MKKKIYLVFALLGTIAPYVFLVRFLLQYGFDVTLFVQMLFANPISSFFAVDFLISCFVFLVFMFAEAKRLRMKKEQWLCLLALFTVGLSLSLPLFLFFREHHTPTKSKA